MELNYTVFRRSLAELAAQYSHNFIKEKSGVHNTKKMVDGRTTPTLSSWLKLHQAFPTDIPRPEYEDNMPVKGHKIAHSSGVYTDTSGTINIGSVQLPPAIAHLVELLVKHDKDGDLANRFVIETIQYANSKK